MTVNFGCNKNKFKLKCMLHYVNATRTSQKIIKILDADYPSLNLNKILVIVAPLRYKQDSHVAIGAYSSALNFPKDYVAEFCIADIDFVSLFGTDKLHDPMNIELDEVDLLDEGPIKDPELGYILKRKSSRKKEFF